MTPIFRNSSSTTGGWSRWNILMGFIYIYHSEHYGLSFLDLTDAFFYKVSLYVYISIFASTLLFNVNLTDSFDDRRSQCRLI